MINLIFFSAEYWRNKREKTLSSKISSSPELWAWLSLSSLRLHVSYSHTVVVVLIFFCSAMCLVFWVRNNEKTHTYWKCTAHSVLAYPYNLFSWQQSAKESLHMAIMLATIVNENRRKPLLPNADCPSPMLRDDRRSGETNEVHVWAETECDSSSVEKHSRDRDGKSKRGSVVTKSFIYLIRLFFTANLY